MSEDASEIMSPDQVVPLRGGKEHIVVKEMSWKASKTFLRALATQAAVFLTPNAQGEVEVDQYKLMGVLMQTLGDELVIAATGMDKAWVEDLAFSDMTALLDKAVELNLRPEMIDGAKNVVRRLSTLVGTATSRTPTTTSAASADTPASTSTPAPGGN